MKIFIEKIIKSSVKKEGKAIPIRFVSVLLVILLNLNRKKDIITSMIDKILCLKPL